MAQTTYYVDATGGDDLKLGTTESEAWQTLSKVNSSTFSPGDQILFKSGEEFLGKLIPPSSGTAGNQIVFGKYGGDARPIINGYNYKECINASGKEYLTFQDLELINNSDDDTGIIDTCTNPDCTNGAEQKRYGFYANSQNGLRRSFVFDNMKIHNIYPRDPDSKGEYNGFAIQFTGFGATDPNYFDGITIQNSELYDVGILGVSINKWGTFATSNIHKNVTITNNYIHHTGGSGIVFFEVDGYLIENNLITYTGDYTMDVGHSPSRQRGRGSGFWCVRTYNGLLQYNEFSHAHGPKDSCGAHIDIGNDNVIIQYNLSWDNAGGFAEYMGDNTNCIYRYNISINDGWRVKFDNTIVPEPTIATHPQMFTAKGERNGQPGSAVWFSNYFGPSLPDVGSFNNSVYNNTFFIGKHIEDTWEVDIDAHIEFENLTDNNEVKNNLFYVSGSSTISYVKEAGAGAGNIMDNNMYNKEAPTDAYFMGPNDIYPPNGWPLLANAGGLDPADYKIAPSSPAIDMGVTMAGNGGIDYFGNSLPGAGSTDIGAHQTFSCGSSKGYTAGGWDSGVGPTTSDLVTLTSDYSTAIEGNFEACQLIVNSGTTLTIAAGDHIKINGSVTIRGDLVIEHGGSLVQVDDGAIVKRTNSGSINVEVTTPNLLRDDFMAMGSPMSGETRADVFGGVRNVQYHTPSNFIPNVAVPGSTNFADDNRDFWQNYTSGNLNLGEGYLIFPQDNPSGTVDLTFSQGTLNNGLVTVPKIYNGAGVNPAGTPNIYSNPYASPISADDFLSANGLTDVYFWEHITAPHSGIPGPYGRNYSMDDISIYNDISGGLAAANDGGSSTQPNGIISTSQGFGVLATSSGNVTFNNSMRLTTGNTTLRTQDLELDRMWFRVSSDAFEYPLGSNTLIAYNPEATDGLDAGDTNRLDTSVSLYSTISGTNKHLTIQSLEEFDQEDKISMGFSTLVEADLEYTFELTQTQGTQLGDRSIYLIDNLLGTITDLTQESHSFRSGAGDQPGRFTLQFEYQTLATSQNELEAIGMYPNPTDGVLNIASPQSPITEVKIFDLQGREVLSQVVHERVTQLDINDLNQSIYMIKISTASGHLVKKLVKR
ncbi:hypothetical protein BST85_03735 [Aureitalea marina]|uniref:Secretion system C-terminal sorting domain-containing protein n=2 Tax=Aureitalea marina TaxID=930804 RepID=A0A2S7KNE2_9FLAO|nr:hypothetical protein BST85_03735 [Aureitalea marina]